MLGEGPDDEASKSTDPRAYPNKSVGARMAIISAGVIMNLILGLACFVYAYGHGHGGDPGRRSARSWPGSPGLRGGHPARRRDRRDRRPPRPQLQQPDAQGPAQRRRARCSTSTSSGPAQTDLIPLDIEPRREATADVPEHRHHPEPQPDPRRRPLRAPGRPGRPAQGRRRRAQGGRHASSPSARSGTTPDAGRRRRGAITGCSPQYRDKPLDVRRRARAAKAAEGEPAEAETVDGRPSRRTTSSTSGSG